MRSDPHHKTPAAVNLASQQAIFHCNVFQSSLNSLKNGVPCEFSKVINFTELFEVFGWPLIYLVSSKEIKAEIHGY